MKLNYFSTQTCPKIGPGAGLSTRLPRVTFNKGGTIIFNQVACELMELKAGDRVTLSQDGETPENWYFHKDKQHGFEVRAVYKAKSCMFNHRELVKTFCEAMEKSVEKTHNFKIAGQPTQMKGDKVQVKYWGILIN